MWAVYSLLSAFGISSSDAFAKKAMEHNVAGARILFVRYLLSVAVLLPFLGAGIPTLDRQLWLLHPVWLPLETVAIYLYIRAIRVSPLSLTLPFLALTPAFLVVTGWVFLGESLGRT
jgi:drug/metabolite transporter (DMT)-like permease